MKFRLIAAVLTAASLSIGTAAACPYNKKITNCVEEFGPVETWARGGTAYIKEEDPYVYTTVTVRSKGGEWQRLYGFANGNRKKLVDAKCSRIDTIQLSAISCTMPDDTVVLYDQGGEELVKGRFDSFPATVFTKADKVAYHLKDAVISRNGMMQIVDLETGKLHPVPQNAEFLNWIRLRKSPTNMGLKFFENASTRPLDLYVLGDSLADVEQVLAVPVGRPVGLGGNLGMRQLYQPLDETGAPMVMPEGVLGIVRVDDQRVPLAWAVAFDKGDGVKFALSNHKPSLTMKYYGSAPVYTEFSRIERDVSPLRDGTVVSYLLSGKGEDGLWVVNSAFDPVKRTLGTPVADGPEAPWRNYLADQQTVYAAERAERDAREAEEAARQKELELAQAEENARKAAVAAERLREAEACHAALVLAMREGRWSQIPQAKRMHTIWDIAHYKTSGSVSGYGDGCPDDPKASYESLASSTLLTRVPTPELVHAAANMFNVDPKRMLYEEAYRRNDLDAGLGLGNIALDEGNNALAWNYFRQVAMAGNGRGFFNMALMEEAGRPPEDPSLEGLSNSLDFEYYLAGLYQRAFDLGYAPADAKLSEVWQKALAMEEDLKKEEKLEYYRQRAALWMDCRAGATPGYDFTCYKNSSGNRVSPWTGNPY